MLFAILALLSGATSYRKVHAFIQAHYKTLDEVLGLNWNKLPAYTTIRDIIHGTSPAEIEVCFREYSTHLAESESQKRSGGFEGKVLRGSFDHFQDQKALQVLSAFLGDSHIILAHEEIAEKTNENPTPHELILKLGLSGYIFLRLMPSTVRKRLWKRPPTLALESPDERAEFEPLSRQERVWVEVAYTGVSSGEHLVSLIAPQLKAMGVTPSKELAKLRDGVPVRIGGMIVSRQRPPTAKGTGFLAIEDEQGLVNVVLPPDIYEASRKAFGSILVVVEGCLQRQGKAVSILAQKVIPLNPQTEL